MASDRLFHFARIAAAGREPSGLSTALSATVLPALAAADARPWGIWSGLFGLRA